MNLRSCLLIWILWLCATAHCASEHGHRKGRDSLIWTEASETTRELAKRNFEERPLLVSVLDGTINAVDKDTGEVLWSFDSEQTFTQATDSADYGYTIVPGVQGELYTYDKTEVGKDGSMDGLQMLPHTVPEWVEHTPHVMSDGSLWLGSRHTHAFFLHPKTGKLLQSFVEYGEGFPQSNASVTGEDGVEPILMGRIDYTVRAIDQKSGEELFNISYSTLRILDKDLKLPAFGDQPALEQSLQPGSLGIKLDPNRPHSIVRQDSETGEELWHVQFKHPPLTLFAGGEIGLSLYGTPSWPPTEKIASRIGLGNTPAPSILIGRLDQSYYALPLIADRQNNLPALTEEIGIDKAALENPRHTLKQLADEQVSALQTTENVSLTLGVHMLQTSTSPLATERFIEGRTQDGAARMVEKTAKSGALSVSSIAGGALAAILVTVWIVTDKPRVIASQKEDKLGATILTLSYTGTTQQAEEARKHSRMFVGNNEPEESSIRDHTGSGVEHFPESEERASSDSNETTSTTNKKKRRKKKPNSTDAARQVKRSQFATSEAQHGPKSQTDSSSSDSEPEPKVHNEELKKEKVDDFRPRLTAEIPQEIAEQMLDEDGKDIPTMEGGPVEQAKASDLLAPEVSVLPVPPPEQEISNTATMVSALRQPQWKDGTLCVGRLVVGPGIVGYGSSGTLVFEGSLDGRKVAVKRILRQFYQLARKEIAALIVADEHPNVVRCFAMEECSEFVYLALERCKQSLNDMLGDLTPEKSLAFCDASGQPTLLCTKICEEIGNGLVALHQSGIVHRDLKPHNVLLTEGKRTKLSDMGLCKRLTTDQTSYDSAPGGSSGWQAPEQLILRNGGQARQGKSVDVFSYGLLLHYCLSGGQHPFGEGYERDYRILNGKSDLSALRHLPEATNLIRAMLRPHSKQRPSIPAIMAHPFWWPASQKLSFLIDISNRLETEDREVDRSLLQALEANAEEAIGGNNWAQKLEAEFLANLGKYRKYQAHSLRDLLRVVRNKHNHFREMPEELQNKIGRTPEQYFLHFAALFPNLLLTTYAFALKHCSQEPVLHKYFPPAANDFPFASAAVGNRFAQSSHFSGPTIKNNQDRSSSAPGAVLREPLLATIHEAQDAISRSKSEPSCMLPPAAPPRRKHTKSQGPKNRGWWSSDTSSQSDDVSTSQSSNSSDSDSQSSRTREAFLNPDDYKLSEPGQKLESTQSKPAWKSSSSEQAAFVPPSPDSTVDWPALPSLQAPEKPSKASSTSPAGESGATIPVIVPPVSLPEPDEDGTTTVEDDALIRVLKVSILPAKLKTVRDPTGFVTVYPQRTEDGATVCDFYSKTGACKYGQDCHFHHPLVYAVKMNNSGLPIRPGQQPCPFYERTGSCKFGAACKFHHPAETIKRGYSE